MKRNYRSRLHADNQARVRCALGEISQVAKLMDLPADQLIAMFESGLTGSDLIEAVAINLAAAIKSANAANETVERLGLGRCSSH